jgi:hypothetical protein
MKSGLEGARGRRSAARRGIIVAVLAVCVVTVIGSAHVALAAGSGCGQPASIAFTQQPPTSVQVDTSFSVAVTVYDACNGVVKNAKDAVSLSPNGPTFPTGVTGTLGGTKSNTPTGGTATFGDLTVSPSGIGYSITASYPGLSSVTSGTFTAYDTYKSCSKSGCSAHANNASTAVDVSVPRNPGNDFVGIGLTPSSITISCSLSDGTSITGATLGSAFNVAPPPGHANADISVTLTISKFYLGANGVSSIVTCTTTDPTTGTYTQLTACPPKGTPTTDCIAKQSSSSAGDGAIIIMMNSTDPAGGGIPG